MKKVLATLFVLGAAYMFTPTSAMADPIHLNIGFGFHAPAYRGYVVERPREVVFEHRFDRREEFNHERFNHREFNHQEFGHRDHDRDRGGLRR